MKQCVKCGELKDLSLFSKGRNQCKECRKIYFRQYDLNRKERKKQYNKQYGLEHKEQKKQYNKQYNIDNKEKRRKQRQGKKEEIKKYTKQYRLVNSEKIRQRYKKYYLSNKEQIKQKNKKYFQSEAGKMTQKRSDAKKRNMKCILLINNPFPKEISVDDHHILNNFHAIDAEGSWNKWFVIPMPKTIHRFVGGTSGSLAHWIHNEAWIRKLYCIDIKELLGMEKTNRT